MQTTLLYRTNKITFSLTPPPLPHTYTTYHIFIYTYFFLNKIMGEDSEKLKTLYNERDYSARAIPPLYNRFCDIIYFKKLIRFVFLYFLSVCIYIYIYIPCSFHVILCF